MPIYPPGSWLHDANRPPTVGTRTAGRFTVSVHGGRFDRHLHDDDEILFIAAGRAKLLLEGEHRYVDGGDVVLVPAGTLHDVLEVYETLSGFFTQTGHPTGGRSGHQHENATDAAGHDVPALPLPTDFPVR